MCLARKFYCQALKSGTNVYLTTLDRYCRAHTLNDEAAIKHRIQNATDLLVERGLFSREFVDSVNIQVCTGYSHIVGPAADSVALVVSKNQIWYDTTYVLSAVDNEFNPYLAHNYYHAQQWDMYGPSFFACEYAKIVLQGGDNTPRKNWMEADAYNYEDSIIDCVVSGTNCPTA